VFAIGGINAPQRAKGEAMEINNNLSVGANRDARIAELEAEVERWRQRTVESAADVVAVQAEVERLRQALEEIVGLVTISIGYTMYMCRWKPVPSPKTPCEEENDEDTR